MRRDRSFESAGIDEFVRLARSCRLLQCERVGVAQSFPRALATAGHRLESANLDSICLQTTQQRATHQRLADTGIGAGDKNCFRTHLRARLIRPWMLTRVQTLSRSRKPHCDPVQATTVNKLAPMVL